MDLRRAWLAFAALALVGCGGGGASNEPYADLDPHIRQWRADLIKSEAACQGKTPEGFERCQQFEVSCKVEDPMTPAERSAGVTHKVLAAITWSEPDPAAGGQRPASATAVFTKSGEGWARQDAEPVNLRTCVRNS